MGGGETGRERGPSDRVLRDGDIGSRYPWSTGNLKCPFSHILGFFKCPQSVALPLDAISVGCRTWGTAPLSG